MDVLAAGALSIAMHQTQLEQYANIAVMKKAMNLQESQAAALIEDLQQSGPFPGDHQLDVLA